MCPDSEFYRREMETDDNHATMRESFCLVQNAFFIDYFHMFPSHSRKTQSTDPDLLPLYLASFTVAVASKSSY